MAASGLSGGKRVFSYIYIYKDTIESIWRIFLALHIRGGVKKKIDTFGWCPPQSGDPPPPPVVVKVPIFFVEKIF